MKKLAILLLPALLILSCTSKNKSTSETIQITSIDSEKWYTGFLLNGHKMPLTDSFAHNYHQTWTYNHLQPIVLSTKGRYAYSEKGWDLKVENNKVIIERPAGEVIINDKTSNLKEGYLSLSKAFYNFSGEYPDEALFLAPQINTWIELGYDHHQAGVLQYADNMLNNGVTPGVIMIDDTWQEDYGIWDFHQDKFPNPQAMIDELHQEGYKVMLWICPFVSPDSKTYRQLLKSGGLVMDSTGEAPKITGWWNGYSAVLDLSHPEGKKWLDEQLVYLQEKYGVDGFKFDAGDPKFYRNGIFHKDISILEQCRLFNEYGLQYPLNEFRTTWKMGGEPMVQRLCDKGHEWAHLRKLIPHMLLNGLMGHPFSCPDMIGGGDINNFNMGNVDEELVVRSAQVHALMPMMQFSVNPFRILNKQNQQYIKDAIATREKFRPYIMEMVKHAATSGEPIVRYMEYEFPGEGLEDLKEQFMLGDKWLVAPVVQKGQTIKKVHLPKGKWKDETGNIIKGGQIVDLKVDMASIPYFEKIN